MLIPSSGKGKTGVSGGYFTNKEDKKHDWLESRP